MYQLVVMMHMIFLIINLIANTIKFNKQHFP